MATMNGTSEEHSLQRLDTNVNHAAGSLSPSSSALALNDPEKLRRKSSEVRVSMTMGAEANEAADAEERDRLMGVEPLSRTKSPFADDVLSDSKRRSGVFGLAPSNAGGGEMIGQAISHPAVPVLSYCAASIVMTVVNKFVVSGSAFTMNFLLLTIQSTVCVLCVVALKKAKVRQTSFAQLTAQVMSYRDFTFDEARQWFPVSFLLVSVIYTGSKSLQFLSIPVYTIFKNLTIILIAYGEVLWFRGTVTSLTLGAFALMVLSSVIAAWSDLAALLTGEDDDYEGAASSVGYIWMFVNVLVSAGYVLGMRKRIKVTNFKDVDVLYLNNALSIPILVVFSLIVEDWSADSLRRNFPLESRNFLLTAMAFSGAAAVFISYTTAWCIRATSSTTYSMVGALNKLPVAASGIVFFSDPATVSSVSAIIVGGIAGVVYAVAKSAQSKETNLTGRR